jgi:hypothetical protein
LRVCAHAAEFSGGADSVKTFSGEAIGNVLRNMTLRVDLSSSGA